MSIYTERLRTLIRAAVEKGCNNLGFLGFFTKDLKTSKVQILGFLQIFFKRKTLKSRF